MRSVEALYRYLKRAAAPRFQSGSRSAADGRLAIYDDLFPHPISGFRFAEFMTYLEHLPGSHIYTTGGSLPLIQEPRSLPMLLAGFDAAHPQCAGRVEEYQQHSVELAASSVYCVFVNNAASIIGDVERNGGRIFFTLYPGGGFRLDDASADEKLRRVLTSPAFKGVVTTQRISHEYLIERGWCDPAQIVHIYGVVVPEAYFSRDRMKRRLYGERKDSIDIIFVAHKYMAGGKDKGFDLFVEVARLLAERWRHLRFHVVGPFSPGDADVSSFNDRIQFHGLLETAHLRALYSQMDMIVSPNGPFILAPGAFDGFPTGCCVEAGLCGVAVFCSDELKENRYFTDGTDLVIIQRDVDQIVDRMSEYVRSYDCLRRIGRQGSIAFQQRFGWKQQMAPRLSLLRRFISM